MKNLLFHNWQAKVACFLIALSIWLYLKNHDDPAFIDQLRTGTLTGH
jgi:YbbR domain-containing protein